MCTSLASAAFPEFPSFLCTEVCTPARSSWVSHCSYSPLCLATNFWGFAQVDCPLMWPRPPPTPHSSTLHHLLRHSPSSTLATTVQSQTRLFSVSSLSSSTFFLCHGLLFKFFCVFIVVFWVRFETTKSRNHLTVFCVPCVEGCSVNQLIKESCALLIWFCRTIGYHFG